MYIVMKSSAHMPTKVKAAYVNIAVVQLTQNATANNRRPSMISERSRDILRIARRWAPVPAAGKTERSGYVQAMNAANQMAHDLNNARDMAKADDIIGAGGSA
jgi:hypothetical protein